MPFLVQSFDPFWISKMKVEGLSRSKVAEVVEVREEFQLRLQLPIDARDKHLWQSQCFEEEGDKTLDESLSLESSAFEDPRKSGLGELARVLALVDLLRAFHVLGWVLASGYVYSRHNIACMSIEAAEGTGHGGASQYEDFPPAGETLESFHKQSSSIGPEFDPFWDFKNEVEGLSKAKDVVVAEVVEVERNSIEATVAIDARDKSVAVTVFEEEGDKTLDESLSLEVVSRYFHLPLAQAAKALQIGEASLKKIRCRLGIKRWPFRKLHSLEKLIKDVQCFKKV
nr:protein RKD1-like [Ipomoea batatas]